MLFLLYPLGVIAHTGTPWISTNTLTCSGQDTCKRVDTYNTLNFVDVDTIVCSGAGTCRGFDLASVGLVECSGEKSCEHMDSVIANDWEVECSGQWSCANQHGWIWAGTLDNLTAVINTYNTKTYELALKIDGQLYPITYNSWAGYVYLMSAEIVLGAEPQTLKKVRYIYVKGLNWVQVSRTVIDTGVISSTTWYRLLYRINGKDTALGGNGARASLAIESDDGAVTSTDVDVYINRLDEWWEPALKSIQHYTERRTIYDYKEWEMAVMIDGHMSVITESIWGSNTRLLTELYVCNLSGVLKLCLAVFEKGLTDDDQTDQNLTKWYKYHYEIGGGISSLAFLSYVDTLPKHRLYYRAR